jgi:formate/nitrite transporter FocA (FNT family)
VLAKTGVFDEDTAEVARAISKHGLEIATGDLFWKGVFAGWLVASMVWLNHAARDTVSRFFIVFFIMFIIPSADLFHCITGACEVFYLMFQGEAGLGDFGHFFSAVVLGNTVGGVLLVAILNNAQTRERRFPDRDCGELTLTWREFLFGLEPGENDTQTAGSNDRAVEEESMLDRPIPTEETPAHG